MTDQERDALVTICLMAAFADGQKGDRERAHLKSIFDVLDADASPALYSRVLLGQADLEAEARKLVVPAHRTLAYEMAVGVCDADGKADGAEAAFLDRLRTALDLDVDVARDVNETGDALADVPVSGPEPALVAEASPALDVQPGAEETDADAMVMKYAVLCGGLELLPQSLATMAIVPLQTKMVYRVGLQHGHRLDALQIKELIATVGLGMTSQVVEVYARKLFGGFVRGASGKALGKKGKKKGKKLAQAAETATGAAMSFASTYALGQVAQAYYGGGRRLGSVDLKALFDRNLERGQALYGTYREDVEAAARQTDLSTLLPMLRSGTASLP